MGASVTFFIFFPQPTWRSHPSTDFDTKWLKGRGFTQGCAFWGKNRNFLKPLTARPPKPQKICPILVGTKFSLDFAFNIRHLYSPPWWQKQKKKNSDNNNNNMEEGSNITNLTNFQ